MAHSRVELFFYSSSDRFHSRCADSDVVQKRSFVSASGDSFDGLDPAVAHDQRRIKIVHRGTDMPGSR